MGRSPKTTATGHSFHTGFPASTSSPAATPTPADAPPPETERERILSIARKHLGTAEILRQPVGVPHALFATVAKSISEPLLSDDQLAAARRLAAEYSSLQISLRACGRDKAALAFSDAQRALSAGTLDGAPPPDAWSKEDFRADFSTRGQALKSALRERSAEAAKIFFDAAGKVALALREHAEAAMIEEFRDHSRFDIAYMPSEKIRVFARAEGVSRRQAEKLLTPGGLGLDPRSMFEIVGIQL